MAIAKRKRDSTAFGISLLTKLEKNGLAIKAFYLNGGKENTKNKLLPHVQRYQATYSTCHDRIYGGATTKKASNEAKQRLAPAEEESLKEQVLRLGSWGWPPLIPTLMRMAQDICDEKGEPAKLGVNWYRSFLARHPELKAKYIPPLDKERVSAEDPRVIEDFFVLFDRVKKQFDIHDDDVYNMDEKGCMIGVIGTLRAIIDRRQKNPYISQPGNREWVSLIECICSTGRVLKGWAIFKGVYQQKELLKAWPDGHICMSKRGWTDNELCLEWFKLCFNPETKPMKKGEYRMLLFDGHGSHLSREVVSFCHEEKIILICLPSHSTHLLQPLDVGVFAPLQIAYQRGVHLRSEMADYQMDKVEFLEIYSTARRRAISESTVKSAWRKTGLFPYNPKIVLSQIQKVKLAAAAAAKEKLANKAPNAPDLSSTLDELRILRSDTATLSERPSTSGGPAPLVAETPFNIVGVNLITSKLKVLDISKEDAILVAQKLSKTAVSALTRYILAESTNQQLVEAQHRVLKKKGKNKGERVGKARVMSLALLNATDKAKAEAANAQKKEVAERKAKKATAKAAKAVAAEEARISIALQTQVQKSLLAEARKMDIATTAIKKKTQKAAERLAAAQEKALQKAIEKEWQAAEKALQTPTAPRKKTPQALALDLSPESPLQSASNPSITLPIISQSSLKSAAKTVLKARQPLARKPSQQSADIALITPPIVTRRGRIVKKKVIFE